MCVCIFTLHTYIHLRARVKARCRLVHNYQQACVCMYVCMFMTHSCVCTDDCIFNITQFNTLVFTSYNDTGGEDPQDALNCGSLSAKEPLIIWLFCGKCCAMIGHSMGLRHSVLITCHETQTDWMLVYYTHACVHTRTGTYNDIVICACAYACMCMRNLTIYINTFVSAWH